MMNGAHGIVLVLRPLIEAANFDQKMYAFGLSPHFTKVFTMVGITKYAELFPTQAEALATFQAAARFHGYCL